VTEKHVLARDKSRRGPQARSYAARQLKALYDDEDLVSRKEEYLEILKRTGSVLEARRQSGLGKKKRDEFRRWDEDFRRREGLCYADPTAHEKDRYLEALRSHYGNKSKARMEAGISRKKLEEWQRESEFAEAEADVYEFFVDEANEQNTRLITGGETTIRDPQHLRWALPKIDKRWEDKPQKIQHLYTGNVTVKSVDEEILLLMGRQGDDNAKDG